MDKQEKHLQSMKRKVFAKFGEEKVKDSMYAAQIAFWVYIHDTFVGCKNPDISMGVDIDDLCLNAVVDYIWQNTIMMEDENDE